VETAGLAFLDRSRAALRLWGLVGRRTLNFMDINPPTMPPGAPTRLDVFLLGRLAVVIEGVEVPTERLPRLRATQLVQLLGLQTRHRLTHD
jgi:hypothetical protein